MTVKENISYQNTSVSQTLDLYLPDKDTYALFVYFHGGGLESGDKRSAARFAPYLTERGIAVISANYRMYPSARYPDFICDAANAVAWASRYAADLHGCDQLYVGGSSAGGYLSMMLCFDVRYLSEAGVDPSAISGYFHDAGQPTAHFRVLRERGTDPRRIIVDESAPLYHIDGKGGYPYMHFVVSDNDMAGRYEQTMLTLATLSHFGHSNHSHTVMHGSHCAYCSAMDEQGESVLGRMIFDFISSARTKQKN